jgi:hypothetical protein
MIGCFRAWIAVAVACFLPVTVAAQTPTRAALLPIARVDAGASFGSATTSLRRRPMPLHSRVLLSKAGAEPGYISYQEPGAASAKPYVLGGAVIGATAMVIGLWIYSEHATDDSITHPLALTPAVLGSAAVGALMGWGLHRMLQD